jgi:hypothetical protein
MGALPYTLEDALKNNMATMLDVEAIEGDSACEVAWEC